MKNLKLILSILFLIPLFTSCYNDGPPSIEIQEQAELMSQDTVVTNYFEAMSNSLIIVKEHMGLMRLLKYRNILEKENANHCNVNYEVFKGDEGFEKYANVHCEIAKLKKEFKAKYPGFSNMSRADRRAIIRVVTEPFGLNMLEGE